ncbi:MAG TPA: hypothetical protein VEU08_04365 [Vicinamibacterales bacterium]|nr:hypothetical protein [Vicinamibacterales bacterium]
MAAGPVLGLSALRPAFLVDVPAAQSRQAEADARGFRAGILLTPRCLMPGYAFDWSAMRLQDIDDPDDDDPDDDDPDDNDEDDDDDNSDEDDDDVETWQVSN